jgi:hypothetical protein
LTIAFGVTILALSLKQLHNQQGNNIIEETQSVPSENDPLIRHTISQGSVHDGLTHTEPYFFGTAYIFCLGFGFLGLECTVTEASNEEAQPA